MSRHCSCDVMTLPCSPLMPLADVVTWSVSSLHISVDVATLSWPYKLLCLMLRHCSSDATTLLPLLFLLLFYYFLLFVFFKFLQNISLSEDSIILH